MQPITKFYSRDPQEEWIRTIKRPDQRLEWVTTWQYLRKFLPKKGLVIDAGGGPGRYTIELAKKGYDVVLQDITPQNLELAKRMMKKKRFSHRVRDYVEGSIVNLSTFKKNTFDAVLCLGGPLSHLQSLRERRRAVAELIRVAKPGAPIFVAVMGYYAFLMNGIRLWPDEMRPSDYYSRLFKKGDDHHWRHSYFAHFFHTEELKHLFSKQVKILAVAGLEGLSSVQGSEVNKLFKDKKAWKTWMRIHQQLLEDPVATSISQHILLVARKK